MVNLQKVKCEICNAQYIIGWIDFDKYDEFCPNCGEQFGIVVISEDYKNIEKESSQKRSKSQE